MADTPKQDSSWLSSAVDLIKWIDNPFKLFEVIILATLIFVGYICWDSRTVILEAITNQNKHPELKDTSGLIPIVTKLAEDVGANTVVIYKANLYTNSRTVVYAKNEKGEDKSIVNNTSSLFTDSPERTKAMIGMLGGDVVCDKIELITKPDGWEAKQSGRFICRSAVPPDVGSFAGYISLTWKEEPKDLPSIKTAIKLASEEMDK
jgi:hypothetical protein